MGNSYCKRIIEVNVVEINQIFLQKIKKNVAMASFYCLVSKIWGKIVFYIVIRRKKRLLCVAQNTNNTTFLCRFVMNFFHDGGRYHVETSPLICRAIFCRAMVSI